MLPRAEILAWRAGHAPWADEDDVEQDLLLTRALCDVFADRSSVAPGRMTRSCQGSRLWLT